MINIKKGGYEAPAMMITKVETEKFLLESTWKVDGDNASSPNGEWSRGGYGNSDEI